MTIRRLVLITLFVAVFLAGAAALAHWMGLRINLTGSAPNGLWIVQPTGPVIRRGTLVEICPPDAAIVGFMKERGYLASGRCRSSRVSSLLKPVSAIAGDTVAIHRGQNARVNGVSLPNTAGRDTIPNWPDGDYVVAPGEVWLFSSYSSGSFDSRYFGPVGINNIAGIAKPLLVNGNPAAMTPAAASLYPARTK